MTLRIAPPGKNGKAHRRKRPITGSERFAGAEGAPGRAVALRRAGGLDDAG